MEERSSHRQRTLRGVAIMAVALGLVVAVPPTASAGEARVQPRMVEGDPTCEDIEPEGEEWAELRVDAPSDGEHSGGRLTVELTLGQGPNGQLVDWESNSPIVAVIVKGGPSANVYQYDPPIIGGTPGDSGLHAPIDPQDEQFSDISRVSFCHDVGITGPLPPPPTTPLEPEPEVAPAVDAQPTFTG